MVDRCVSVDGTFYQLISFADSVRNRNLNQFFTIKTIHRNLCICCYDNAVCICDFLISQYVFGTAGSSCFYFNGTVMRFCCFFQTFSCHVSMRDTGRAGCNCNDLADSALCFCLSCQLIVQIRFFLICRIYDFQKFIYGRCIFQIFHKILIHKQHRKFTEYIQMDVILSIRSCDQEKQVDRLIIQRVKIYAIFDDHSCQSRFADRITFSMWDCYSFADTRCAFFFS